jgi:DNA sulfur modification protein DndB
VFINFHCLDEEISWISTQLTIDPNSPLYNKGTLIGKRTKEKHITLQNVYNFLLLLIKNTKIAELPKEKILNITLTYFNCIKELLPVEWSDYKQYRLPI